MVDGPTPLRFSLFGGGLTLDSRLLLTRLLEVQRQPLLLLQSEQNRLRQIAQTLRQAQGVLSTLRERLTALLREPLVGTRTVTVAGPLRATVSDPRAVRVMLGPGATPRTFTLFIERLAGFTRVTSTARLGAGTNPAERVPRGEESRHRREPRPVDLDRPLARTNFAVPLRGTRGEFMINDVMIPWDATVDTLRTIIERINQANAGVVATYDPTTDRLTLTATRPGPEPIRLRDVTGNLLAVLSSLFYAAYFLTTQRGRTHFSTLTYVFLITAVSSLILLGTNLLLGNPLWGYSTPTLLAFLGAGLISQVIGYFSVGYALGHLPASLVSPTMIAQPVLTALMAIPLAGEPLLPPQWIGGLIVLSGIYLVNLSRQKETAASVQNPTPVSD